MANETEYSNIVKVAAVISDGVTPALVDRIVVAPLIRYEPLPVGQSNAKLFRKDGNLTAEEVNESTVHTVDAAGQELTQTSVTATAVKLCSNCILSVEAQTFTSVTLADISRKIAEAIARDWDDEILALFSGFTGNTVTSTSVLTINDILEAVYKIRAASYGVSGGQLKGVFDFKGIFEIQKELTASSAAHLGVPGQIELLAGIQAPNGYVGSKAGVDFYQTSGLPTSGSDDVALVFDPQMAFGAMAAAAPVVNVNWLGGAGSAQGGYSHEVSGYFFCDVIEWNDACGCAVNSDT
jgi:hypothetical protein